MKYINSFKIELLILVIAVFATFFASCNENINIGPTDESNYESSAEALGYIIDGNGNSKTDSLEFIDRDSTDLYVGASKETTDASIISLNYDATVLNDYNTANATSYTALPQSLVSLSGDVTIAKGETKSSKAIVTYTTSNDLDSCATYVIPLKASIKSGSIKMSEAKSKFLLFVKDLSKTPNCNKSTGIKIISCMEVNDTNPLNNLCFTLKKSGKPLIDIVILFSGNINYNDQTGRVYIYNNENIQHLLDYKEKYLRPLQKRGIKVVLGILGNHDRSGVANLSTEAARQFAQEEKAICDAYNLDGIFFDDEYSSYQNPVPPGFVSPSSAAASRLCYETKKAMPNKLVCAYAYGSTSSLPDIDGQQSGTFVDYGIHDYGGSSDLSSNYPGMLKSGMALYSEEFSRGYFASESNLKNLRNNGYGAHMIFAMDPNGSNFSSRQLPAMQQIAKTLFDDELIYNGKPCSKDW